MIKEIGEYIVIKKIDFEKYKNAYDKYELKKKQAREYMSKKYNEKKQAKLLQVYEHYDDPFNDPEFMFQFEHVS